jgi:uncharacterized protein DUF3301
VDLIVLFAAVAATAWFWYDSMRAREAAHAAGRDACLRAGLQLLDDTVTLTSLRPVRDSRGRFALRRVYVFEFTDTGDNRRQGSVVLLRGIAGGVELEPHRMQ